MPPNAPPQPGPDPLRAAVWAILALTAYRVALLPFATADLFVDEAQYWLWGQELDWGYYSKPPLIGWVIRGFTELAASSSAFWIRLPGPVFHAATAFLLIGAARGLTGRAAAGMAGLTYATLPSVGVGSFLISTDTILMPFFAGAAWAWLRLVRGRDIRLAILLGLCLGLGMMAKYAAIYFLLCAALGWLFLPASRIAVRDAMVAGAVFVAVILPNVVWNLQNDLATLSHTADNVDWVRQPGVSFNVAGAAEFFLAQFGVFGPVLFGAYLVAAVRAFRQPDWRLRWLVILSAPILLLVTIQALLSRAYANWAATAVVGIVLLAAPWLWNRWRPLFWASLAINLALVLAIPVAATRAQTWRLDPDGRLVLRRFVGRSDLSRAALELARSEGITAIVAENRDMLADLFHTGRGSGLAFFAPPHDGHPPHYYAQKHGFSGNSAAPVLFMATATQPPCEAEIVGERTADAGAYAGQHVRFFVIPGDCWSAAKAPAD